MFNIHHHLRVFILLCVCSISFSQNIYIPNKFTQYTTLDGLSSPLIRAITQDKSGYIWIGTEDGLNKFDGYEFKSYGYDVTNNAALPDNFITCLAPTSDGGIVVGTLNGGFAKYNSDRDNFKVYRAIYGKSGALQHNSIGALYEDTKGNLWVGTFGGSLFMMPADADTFKWFNHSDADTNTLANTLVVGIVEDNSGNIWVRTFAGLSKIENETGQIVNYNIDRPTTEFQTRYTGSTIIDKDGIIWMGWNNEIIKFNTKTDEVEYRVPTGLPLSFGFVSSICEHDDNNLWIGTWAALYLYNKNQNTAIPYYHNATKPETLPLEHNEALFKDNSQVLWCSALAKLNLTNKKIQHITNTSSGQNIQDNNIRSLFVDSHNKYWIATNMGLTTIDPSSNTSISYSILPDDTTHFLNSVISAFEEDNQGNIWMAVWGQGIVVLRNGDPKDFYRIRPNPDNNQALQHGDIEALFQDANGFMWIGTSLGIDIMDVTTLQTKFYPSISEDPNTPTPFSVQSKCIDEDDNGYIWFGTWGGLTQARILNPELGLASEIQFTRYVCTPGTPNTISDSRVMSLLYDKEHYPGVLFAGTYGGGINAIYLNNTGKVDSIQYITTKNGLSNNTIYGMLTDSKGNIWTSTNLGICHFNPDKNEFHTYDISDGLQANYFSRSAYAKGKSNMLFGGVNGLNIFNPLDIGKDTIAPLLVFTEFEIEDKKVNVGQKFNRRVILKHNINDTKKIVLTHKEKTFTISFSALHYAYPGRNKYEYILEGFDKHWLSVDANVRRVSYSNLKPGKYTLKVKASNLDDVLMATPREIKIKIRTPWWRSIFFYIILSALIFFTIYYFFRKREQKAIKDKDLLQKRINEGESLIAEKMKEVEKQQNEIKQRDEKEKEIRYYTEGIARFSDILNETSDNIDQLLHAIISELVNYVGGCLGCIYLVNNDKEESKYLELKSEYATDTDSLERKQILIGEGYVGTCFIEKEILILNDIPENYIKYSSGLGESIPQKLYFIPLKQNEIIEGVIEIAAFDPLEKFKLDFIEKIAENITANITIHKAKINAENMFQQSKLQEEQLHQQEEEMRQNLEELMATQDEYRRKDEEKDKIIEELKKNLKQKK